MRTLTLLLALFLASPILADEPKTQKGIPYAEPKNERQMLDVYAPATGKNMPVVVWIHGGGWRRGDKADVHNKPKAFTEKGFVLVSISYRFVPNVTVDQIAGDVAKAIRWTHDHARDSGGDPSRIIVAGHSAGAQLAALVCTDDRYLKAEKLPLSIIKGCVPVDGDTYDVAMQIKTVEDKRAMSYRMTFGDETSQKNLSSVTHVAKGKNIPPFLILHVADHPETKAQSQRLVKVLEAAGISAKAYPAEGKNHTTLNVDLGPADDPATRQMFAFLSAVFKAGDAFRIEKDFTSLFNGKDMTGWEYGPVPVTKKPIIEKLEGKTVTKDGVFEVKDGHIIATGKRIMALYTAKEYNKDFIFKVEFRNSAEKPKDNSGIYIRGPQLQLDAVTEGGLTGVFRKLTKFKVGDWNEIEITVKGTEAICKCNGEMIGKKAMNIPATGTIGLQSEYGKFEFRRIRIKELP